MVTSVATWDHLSWVFGYGLGSRRTSIAAKVHHSLNQIQKFTDTHQKPKHLAIEERRVNPVVRVVESRTLTETDMQ